MKKLVTQTLNLWILFVLTAALMAGFAYWSPSIGGTGLDSVGPVSDVQALLASMTSEQKQSHFWMTLLLDMLFPLAYGGLFAGLALKHARRYGVLLAIPAIIVIPVDIVENIIQLLALKGSTGLLTLKSLLTPTKFFLFYTAAVIALGSLIFGMLMKLLKK
ncbi:MAG: hypothetical protein COA96_12995 [SAR86 cluster bacterium]|uniref:Uncharacterized protein n=1 Tax=SAR86 cluster bacterium TaxID=2030880 RepID=A0A2A5AV28_9GAMM|nr:MAG: hypothetical protein COA96_12995 [SAR86 cluster bacterium]